MFNKIRYFPVALILFSLLSACSIMDSILRSSTPPDWTLGESAKYPNTTYMSATGSAEDAETAKDRAMANLSKIFESHIVGETNTSSDVQTHQSSDGEKVSSKQRLVQHVNVYSNQVLEGVQIVEQWQNTADLTYYALAVVNRQHVGGILEDKIQKLDQDTAFELSSIENQKDDLAQIGTYQRIIQLQKSRNDIQKLLKVVDLKGKGLQPKWSLVELKAYSASALSAIKMTAYVQPKGFSGLKQQLQAAMAQAGFPASNSEADYTLLAGVDLQDAEKKGGWYWLRGTLTIRLIDALSGVTRGSHVWSLKASAVKQAQLLSRFRILIDNALKKELQGVLIGFAGKK